MLGNRRSARIVMSAVASAATVVALLATGVAPAQAAIKAPAGLQPSGPAASSTPTFTWGRVSGATGYQLVITSDSTTQQVVSTSTANNRYVPTNNLADGSYSWQVRATGPAGNGPWASASTAVSPTAPPSPTSPVGGAQLAQPDSPALLKWSAVQGASGYEVQVDNTGSWVSPTTYQVKGNAYFVDTPQAPGDWYWRVRAVRGAGLYTSWSGTAHYQVMKLSDPQAGADMNTGTPMQDVRIDWLPVDGATAYQLQVGRDPDFNNIVDDRIVDGTSFSPGTTYDNDQYYWRVRAIDAGQNRMPWTTSAPFTFQRNWPDQPTLEFPANQLSPTVGDPMYYQWTPVRRASRYQLDVGSDPNFSPGTYNTCTTTGTTFPVNGQCGPMGAGATTYWRVKGLDDPRGVEGIFSDIHRFVYSSGRVTQLSPANGATVSVPTLTWQPVADVQTYSVSITDTNGQVVTSTSTSSRTWTPEVNLPASGNPYTWTVQTVSAQNVVSPLYAGKTFNVSGAVPTSTPALVPITGVAADPATGDFPNLTWGALAGASYYRVRIGVQGSSFWDANASHISGATYAYPAATDTGTHYLSPGTYFWFVDAYDSSNHQIGETPGNQYGQFTVKDLPVSSGQEVALDGMAAVAPAPSGCTNALSDVVASSQICVGVPATPVLKWDAEPGAAGYLVYLANDQELTNRVIQPYATTTNTMFRPPADLPDNTAQDSYYWFVRPCKSLSPVICNPDPISTHAAATNAFRKQSPAVALQTPVDGASLATDPTFSWTDYYDTNQARQYANGTDPSYQTARTYRIQISPSSTFATNVDDREVDQPFYTPNDRTLPQGTLYWRVQVVDPTNNHVTWSPVRSFSNDQPAIDLVNGSATAPTLGSSVGGTPTFRWTPMDGASSYQIEVYRNNDTTHSDANRLIQTTTKVPAFVPSNYLPTSASSYRWRVRWFDADGQPRPWSSDATFAVRASGLTTHTPTSGTYQRSNGLYFTWDPAPFASAYLLTVRDAASNNAVAQWSTAATAYAPDRFNDGSFEWRVSALDPNGNPIAASGWKTFKVDSQGPVVTSYSPNPSGKPTSTVKVVFNEKVIGVSTSSFTLHVGGRTSRLPAHVKVASTKRSATLTPTTHLKKGKTYTVKVTKTVHDAAGNHMKTFTWSFTV